MGEIRFKEMQCVEKVLGLKGMTVLDLPDGELKKMDPHEIDKAGKSEIDRVKPAIVVTYAEHGKRGLQGHLVTQGRGGGGVCAGTREGTSNAPRRAADTRQGHGE